MRAMIEQTTALLDCERATIFVIDQLRKCLTAKVATGNIDEFDIPLNSGIAGHVAMTGIAVRIDDVYSDPRFNSSVDARMGFRTKNMMCLPIPDADGETVAVVQVLNKRTHKINGQRRDAAFTDTDRVLFGVLATQAGLVLQHSALHDRLQLGHDALLKLIEVPRALNKAALPESRSRVPEMLRLVQKIEELCLNITKCRMCKCFIVDSSSGMMWHRSSEVDYTFRKVSVKQFSKIDSGLAGLVASSQESLNVTHPDTHPRYNGRVDIDTKSLGLFCVPLVNHVQQTIGVLQVSKSVYTSDPGAGGLTGKSEEMSATQQAADAETLELNDLRQELQQESQRAVQAAEADAYAKGKREATVAAEEELAALRAKLEKAEAAAQAAADAQAQALSDAAAAEQAAREAEKTKREAEEKVKREAEEKVKREAEEKAKREAEEKAKREAEEKAKREAEEKAKREVDEKVKSEAEEKAKREADEKVKSEAVKGSTSEAEKEAVDIVEAKAEIGAEVAARQADTEAKPAPEAETETERAATAEAGSESQAEVVPAGAETDTAGGVPTSESAQDSEAEANVGADVAADATAAEAVEKPAAEAEAAPDAEPEAVVEQEPTERIEKSAAVEAGSQAEANATESKAATEVPSVADALSKTGQETGKEMEAQPAGKDDTPPAPPQKAAVDAPPALPQKAAGAASDSLKDQVKENPAGDKESGPASAEAAEGEWAAYQDENGQTYYYNTATGETSWENPDKFSLDL
eukprot:g8085.t1